MILVLFRGESVTSVNIGPTRVDNHLGSAETPSPRNPIEWKGVGESGAIAAPAADINAIVDAPQPFDVDRVDMPATPERGSGRPAKTNAKLDGPSHERPHDFSARRYGRSSIPTFIPLAIGV